MRHTELDNTLSQKKKKITSNPDKVILIRCVKSNLSVRACLRVTELSRSAGGRGNMLRTLEQSGVVRAHLEWSFAGDVWRAASSCPCVRVKELSRVIGAVTETRPVEIWMRPVQLLRCISLHEQVDRHHACRLQDRRKSGSVRNEQQGMKWNWELKCYLSEQEGDGREGERPAVFVAEVRFVCLRSVQHLIIDVGDI